MKPFLLSPQHQAHIYASGLATIFVLGTLSLVVVCLAALWCVFQLAVLILASIVECSLLISALYQDSPPVLKLLILASIGFMLYKTVQKGRRANV
ncbi:MAG TPA: hypothetical protein VFV38_13505 [Ktedonobacteraceae bacterium]|nr:hypothetical protein [Ktedonobacteraceae bacterium]